MARAGQANIAAQRLLFDKLIAEQGKTFAKAALAVAADAVGDNADRDALLNALLQTPPPVEFGSIVDYGTGFRDQLAALTILAEADLTSEGAGEALLLKNLPSLAIMLSERTLTTQEQAWALRLAVHLGQGDVAFTDLAGSAQIAATSQDLATTDFDGKQAPVSYTHLTLPTKA